MHPAATHHCRSWPSDVSSRGPHGSYKVWFATACPVCTCTATSPAGLLRREDLHVGCERLEGRPLHQEPAWHRWVGEDRTSGITGGWVETGITGGWVETERQESHHNTTPMAGQETPMAGQEITTCACDLFSLQVLMF